MAHSLLKDRTAVDKCLCQFSLDSDDEITDLLAPPTRFVEFEIAHGMPNSIFEEHEIIRIHSVPADCDREELCDAIEDYYQLYFTGETFMAQQAIKRLII
jgi:hypothetical protein